MVTIVARRHEEAKSLAADVGCRVIVWEERYASLFEIVVNCTPVGMYPKIDDSAFHQSSLRESTIVLDTVYNPENTLLIREAKASNCKVVTGIDMFALQAE